MRNIVLSFLLVLMVLFSLGQAPARAASPLSGTPIQNEIKINYRDGNDGLYSARFSNRVSAKIRSVYNLTLSADHTQSIPPGLSVNLAHRLTNTGNATTSYQLDFTNQSGDNYDLSHLALILDQNGNGRADSGERIFSPGNTVELNPGSFLDLIVAGLVPPGALPKSHAQVTVTATALDSIGNRQKSAINTDTLVVQSAALMTLVKSASSLAPKPQDTVEFTLVGTNIGNEPATGIPITVDGQPQSRIVVRDTIPANTLFVQLMPGGQGIPLYHRMGDPLHTYTTTPPPNLKDVDAVGYAFTEVRVQGGVIVLFQVQIKPNAGGTIKNASHVFFHNAIEPIESESNTVFLTLPTIVPTIRFYTDATFTEHAMDRSPGDNLYVQAETTDCNTDPAVSETREVILSSVRTGDTEIFTAIESAPDSGQFQILPFVITDDITLPGIVVKSGDGRLQLAKNDTLKSRIEGCGGDLAEVILLIDPFGVVSDAKTGAPISGAVVTLMNETPNGLATVATVFKEDGVTPSPNPVTTGSDGEYTFPLVADGNYRLVQNPPAGYICPTSLPQELLPPSLVMDPKASYGKVFPVNAATGAVHADLPCDFVGSTGLLVQKKTSQPSVEIGDFVNYTLVIKNLEIGVMERVHLVDQPPTGFVYVPGSARLNGAPTGDPSRSPQDGTLSFVLGTLLPQSEETLTYTLRVGVGAQEGDNLNRAQAFVLPLIPKPSSGGRSKPLFALSQTLPASPLIESNIATAVVKLGTFFTKEAYIFGKVYADCSRDTDHRDRIQNEGELGMPGVRLYLENGTFVITDSEGEYSLYGLSPRTHILKLDRTTLPSGANLVELANRNAGDPGSRFIDLKRGELHKADFAIESCSGEILDAIKQRRESAQERDGLDIKPLNRFEQVPSGDRGNLPANGIIGPDGPLRADEGKSLPLYVATLPSDSTSSAPVTTESRSLSTILQGEDNTLDFIGIHDGETRSPLENIRIKGLAGTELKLIVNGTEIKDDRVGEAVTIPDHNLEGREYIGVQLVPGENRLEIVQADSLGNTLETKRITVKAPGQLKKIELALPKEPIADGVTPVMIGVRLLDENGLEVTSRTPLTIEAIRGQWQIEDLDPVTPGVQQFLEGGAGAYRLTSPLSPGEETVWVSSGAFIKTEGKFSYLHDLRPMLAAGLIEGTLNLRKFDKNAILAASREDDFEETLEHFSHESDDRKTRLGGRAALFLKGKVKGSYLLTLGYDSDKDKERLFRDIQPDQFYPVYGDSSVRGFDAQSTERLYVRVDKNKSFLLYGDYSTRADSQDVNLGAVNRSLSGVKEHFESGRLTANLYVSEGHAMQQVEEFEANGTSGPFFLASTVIRENSEQIEVLVRDRNQPAVVLTSALKTRFHDYVIEPFTGRILFTGPIPSVDENLNPIFIRVSYEVEAGGNPFWIVGEDASLKVSDWIAVGATRIDDRNPQAEGSLTSAHLSIGFGERSRFVAETAYSDKAGLGKGDGARADLTHTGEKLTARLYTGRTDVTFENPQAGLVKGRSETGLQLRYKIGSQTHLATEAIQTEDILIHGRRRGALVSFEQSLKGHFRLETGLRYAEETGSPASPASVGATPLETISARVKVNAQVPTMPELTGYGEYEQDIHDAARKRLATGGEYILWNRGRLYLRHEWISSLNGTFALNSTQRQDTTLIGMDTPYMTGGNLFSEYRVQDTIAGPDAHAAMGVRNFWNIAEGTRVNSSFERTKKVRGEGNSPQEATAVTGGIEYTRPSLWKGTGRLEFRDAVTTESLLNTLGFVYKLDTEWSLLARNIFATTDSKNQLLIDRMENRFQIGTAYRPTATNRLSGLFRFEEKMEKDGAVDRQARIASTHVNYQPSAPMIMSGRYAVRHQEDRNMAADSLTQLVRARMTCDVTAHVDVGLTGSFLWSEGGKKQGLGVEAGYLMAGNLWLSGGYNWFGFTDRDLAGSDYTAKGPYIRLRFKFDENLFDEPPTLESRRRTHRGWGCWQQEPPPPALIQEIKVVPLPELTPYVEVAVVPPPAQPVEEPIPSAPTPAIEETPLPPQPIQEAEQEPAPAPKPAPIVLPIAKTIVMPDAIHFAFDRATLSPVTRSILDRVTEVLKENPEVTVTLAGHTDIWGSILYNKKLAARRSTAVLNYLMGQGVSEMQLTAASFGEEKPKYRGRTLLDHARNRRVEIIVTQGKSNLITVSQEDDLQVSKRRGPPVEARASSRAMSKR